ncbi:MAG: peroxiredoxin family protein [Myxococcota bacterium]
MRFITLCLLPIAACGPNGQVPSFSLEDVNEASATFGQELGPQDFEGQVSAWYFGLATCPICQRHIDELDAMAGRLANDQPNLAITVLGINQWGRESANADITEGHTIAWLQDTEDKDVWAKWPPAVTRELKIVGPDLIVAATFDLNVRDPGDESVQNEIEAALIDLASAEE